MGVKSVGGLTAARNRGVELLTGGGPQVEFRRYMGQGREGRAWEASWRRGGADVGLGRGWGAAGRPVHGGAGSLVRRSKAGRGLGFGAAATGRR
jgi:hypothetical protein